MFHVPGHCRLLGDCKTITWVVPLPRIPVTTRIIIFLVGDPYKPSFATVTGRGDNPNNNILAVSKYVCCCFCFSLPVDFLKVVTAKRISQDLSDHPVLAIHSQGAMVSQFFSMATLLGHRD